MSRFEIKRALTQREREFLFWVDFWGPGYICADFSDYIRFKFTEWHVPRGYTGEWQKIGSETTKRLKLAGYVVWCRPALGCLRSGPITLNTRGVEITQTGREKLYG